MVEESQSKICLILLWLIWPVGLIWYLVDEKMREDSFAKFHFKQWLMAAIVTLGLSFIAGILSVILIGLLLFPVIFVFTLIWFIQAIIFIVKGEKENLLIIGKYAEKLFTF